MLGEGRRRWREGALHCTTYIDLHGPCIQAVLTKHSGTNPLLVKDSTSSHFSLASMGCMLLFWEWCCKHNVLQVLQKQSAFNPLSAYHTAVASSIFVYLCVV
jgi:hypothetical protein